MSFPIRDRFPRGLRCQGSVAADPDRRAEMSALAATVIRMSCIRFSTAPQRDAMRHEAEAVAGGDRAILHLSPPVTQGKLARLRLLARHALPGIRQSVASNRHAPADLLQRLAADDDPAVRGEVARNENAPAALVEALAADADPRVRCWAVLNPSLDAATVAVLADDPDGQVRRLAGWRRAAVQPT